MKQLLLLAGFLVFQQSVLCLAQVPDDGKLRIICFGAHPDDCELLAGGVGAMWASQGHPVKFVAVTNGDIGHWREAGGPLARRRTLEVQQASRILGTTVAVLDNHDGELMPTLENRRQIIRLIREWKADVVLSHRPYDYHRTCAPATPRCPAASPSGSERNSASGIRLSKPERSSWQRHSKSANTAASQPARS